MKRSAYSLEPGTGSSGTVWKLIVAVATVLAIGSVASPAFAEDEGDEEIPEGPLGEKLDDYWSVDRDVDVIKNRLYEREGRFAVGLHGGLMSSEPFHWYLPVGARLDYYLSNNFGLELEGSFMDVGGVFRHDTDLTSFVKAEKPGFDPDTDALDTFKWRAHALAVWHPFYGKLALLQRKLAHFDLNLAAGFGAVSVTRPNETRSQAEDVITPEFVFGGGVHFFTSENVTIRLTGRGYLYQGPMNYKNTETGELHVSVANPDADNIETANFFQKLELPTEFLLGVSYMF